MAHLCSLPEKPSDSVINTDPRKERLEFPAALHSSSQSQPSVPGRLSSEDSCDDAGRLNEMLDQEKMSKNTGEASGHTSNKILGLDLEMWKEYVYSISTEVSGAVFGLDLEKWKEYLQDPECAHNKYITFECYLTRIPIEVADWLRFSTEHSKFEKWLAVSMDYAVHGLADRLFEEGVGMEHLMPSDPSEPYPYWLYFHVPKASDSPQPYPSKLAEPSGSPQYFEPYGVSIYTRPDETFEHSKPSNSINHPPSEHSHPSRDNPTNVSGSLIEYSVPLNVPQPCNHSALDYAPRNEHSRPNDDKPLDIDPPKRSQSLPPAAPSKSLLHPSKRLRSSSPPLAEILEPNAKRRKTSQLPKPSEPVITRWH